MSDTTLRTRRDEWIAAGVFDRLRDHAVAAYDRIIGLDLSEVSLDGSFHKAPCGGEGTGKNPTDRAKLGWKWSIATDARGIPIGWAIDGAHRNDIKMLLPTLDDVARWGFSTRSRPCTSTAATTIPRSVPNWPTAASTISTFNGGPGRATRAWSSNLSDSDSDGWLKAPTRG